MAACASCPQRDGEWRSWFERLSNEIDKSVHLFIGISPYSRNAYEILKDKNIFEGFNLSFYLSGLNFKVKDHEIERIKHKSLQSMIYMAEAASIYGIFLAEYMGYNETILLGMDHDYFLYDDERKMRIYESSEHQRNEIERTFGNNFYVEEFQRQYKIFKKYQAIEQSFNTKIVSCSGPVLKVFKRKNYDEIVKSEID